MMRTLKRMMTILMLVVLTVPLVNCASKSEAAAPENPVVPVQRGDLKTDITGVGNLALSRTVDLPFDIPAAFDKTVALTVQDVLIQEGDSVKEGQLLAKLDTPTWEDQVSKLEDKVTLAERNLTAKQRAETATEQQIATKELAVSQAELNLQTAQNYVSKIDDVKKAQAAVDEAKYDLKVAHLMQKGEIEIENYESLLDRAQKNLEDILNGTSINVSSNAALAIAQEVAKSKLQVEQAKGSVEDARIAVENARLDVEVAKTAVVDVRKALENAQKALNEAKNASPEIKAPFSGFITRVNVVGGAEIKKGTVAVTIADPAKFEAGVMVSELDILKLKLDGDASVQVQAMPGLSLPAKVTHISPTATIQSGVVNYKVKVEVTSLRPVTLLPQTARGNSGNISSGGLSGGSRRSFAGNNSTGGFRQPSPGNNSTGGFGRFSGDNLTQEQINQMMQQRQQALAGQPGGQVAQTSATSPAEVKLVEGLTVTVSITIAERNGVLLVPVQAIISQGGNTIVQVSKGGVIEQRSVTVGVSNFQYAEITSGLSEGEQVIVPKAMANTTPTTSQQGQRPGGIMIPGLGGARR
ncbi:MAG: HlyD family efflux transporter periplasmic adaptor subunit [Chloroflexi bacterium]|nr:HlyD family efflux transporter periplasmic adaptor subunit [Chloroflexota bacterium]